jgi:Uma2 family endonuclease
MDTPWHRAQMNLLIECVESYWRDRDDFYVGGDMFIYFSLEEVFNKDFRGPDFFCVKGVSHKDRPSWVVWEENGRYPDVIIELLSESTAHIDRGRKKHLYQDTFGTAEYFLFDPIALDFEGWALINKKYEPVDLEENGRRWSRQFELYLGPWKGRFLGYERTWLRFFDVHGNLIPTFAESEKALGDEARRKADQAKRLADEEKLRADKATQQADEEKLRADKATQQADEEKLRADKLSSELDRLRRELEQLKQPPA